MTGETANPHFGSSFDDWLKEQGIYEEVEALRTALIEGEQSGPSEPFDSEAFLKRMRARHVR